MVNTLLFTDNQDHIECSWMGFHDPESKISHFVIGIGPEEGFDTVYAFTELSGETSRHRAEGNIFTTTLPRTLCTMSLILLISMHFKCVKYYFLEQ